MARTAFRRAWSRLWRALVVLFAVGFGFLIAVIFVPGLHKEVPPRLLVRDLSFRDGMIYQDVGPAELPEIAGTWNAAIWSEAGRLICHGSGSDLYEPKLKPLIFTPDQWTGDRCEMTRGATYRGEGLWRWWTAQGQQAIGRSFTFTYRPQR